MSRVLKSVYVWTYDGLHTVQAGTGSSYFYLKKAMDLDLCPAFPMAQLNSLELSRTL